MDLKKLSGTPELSTLSSRVTNYKDFMKMVSFGKPTKSQFTYSSRTALAKHVHGGLDHD